MSFIGVSGLTHVWQPGDVGVHKSFHAQFTQVIGTLLAAKKGDVTAGDMAHAILTMFKNKIVMERLQQIAVKALAKTGVWTLNVNAWQHMLESEKPRFTDSLVQQSCQVMKPYVQLLYDETRKSNERNAKDKQAKKTLKQSKLSNAQSSIVANSATNLAKLQFSDELSKLFKLPAKDLRAEMEREKYGFTPAQLKNQKGKYKPAKDLKQLLLEWFEKQLTNRTSLMQREVSRRIESPSSFDH